MCSLVSLMSHLQLCFLTTGSRFSYRRLEKLEYLLLHKNVLHFLIQYTIQICKPHFSIYLSPCINTRARLLLCVHCYKHKQSTQRISTPPLIIHISTHTHTSLYTIICKLCFLIIKINTVHECTTGINRWFNFFFWTRTIVYSNICSW